MVDIHRLMIYKNINTIKHRIKKITKLIKQLDESDKLFFLINKNFVYQDLFPYILLTIILSSSFNSRYILL